MSDADTSSGWWRPDKAHARYDWIVVAGLGAVLVFTWLIPMTDSLWLDELGTYWVIDEGPRLAIERSSQYHGQTPVYYLILQLFVALFGSTEWALRLPSFLALVATGGILWTTAGKWFGKRAKLPTIVALAAMPTVAEAAAEARPYGLGLLLAVTSTVLLVAWVERPGLRNALMYSAAVGSMVAVHYVLLTVGIAHACILLYAAVSGRLRLRDRWVDLIGGSTLLAMMLAPMVPQIIALLDRSDQLLIPFNPTALQVILETAQPDVYLPIVVGFLVAALRRTEQVPTRHSRSDEFRWAAAFIAALAPSLFLLLLGLSTDLVLWQDRYRLAGLPFLALICGGAVARYRSDLVRAIALVAVIAGAIAFFPTPRHLGEYWDEALEHVDSQFIEGRTEVLLGSGFIESADPVFIGTAANRSYLNSPLAYYGDVTEATPLAYAAPLRTMRARLESTVGTPVDPRVIAIFNQPGQEELSSEMHAILGDAGYRLSSSLWFGSILVESYDLES